jgi:phage terminase large subunit-like protein
LAPARYKGAHGGRGSGKSHFFAELGVERCLLEPGTRMVCVREVQKSLRESVKLLIEDKIKSLSLSPMFNILHDRIEAPGNGLILFQGMADHTAESIKSLEAFDVAYVEEAQTFTQRSLELLRPTIRERSSEIWFSWNPRSASDPVDAFLRGPEPPENSTVVRTSYLHNPFFPAVLEDERLLDERINRHRYGHIWLGEYEPMAIGAIWDRLTIHEGRRDEAPELGRCVVAVDPAVSAEPGSDYHGIVVCAEGTDGRGYVLEDGSRKGTPKQWATRAVALFDKHEADAIVIEINQGGDMVRHTLATVRPTVPIIEVRATKGKHVRAEPIAALYSLGRISHVGALPELEDQMCQMTAAGYEGEGSPDRVDALVWGLSELFPSISAPRLVDDDDDYDLADATRSEIGGY